MSDQTHTNSYSSTSSGNTGLGFIVGGLVVAVAVIAFFLFAGGEADNGADDVTVTIEGAGDAVEGAAGAIEGAAEGAASAVEGAAEQATGN